AVTTAGGVRTRSAYHFQPAKNWQNDPNGTPQLLSSLPLC
uniref:Uncharacterized protein n=1 Tax=Aegilops tauschii subsp. strangulata TaxID=200361 RepID=A0A453D3S7_AEGTS